MTAAVLSFTYVSQGIAAAQDGSSQTSPLEQPARPLLARTIVIGASASAGFGQPQYGTPLRPVGLAHLWSAAFPESPGEVVDASDIGMGVRAAVSLRFQVEHALAADPTLVLALDALFWAAYGMAPNDTERWPRLEAGLDLLDRFDVPMLVGDLPDMNAALDEQSFLSPQLVPARKTLAAMNKSIELWCAGREHVALIPLAEMVGRMHGDRPIRLRASSWKAEGLVQRDRLHPTMRGLEVMTFLALDSLTQHWPLPEGTRIVKHAAGLRRHLVVLVKRGAPAVTSAWRRQ